MKYDITVTIELDDDQNANDAIEWMVSTLLIANPKLKRLREHPYKPEVVKAIPEETFGKPPKQCPSCYSSNIKIIYDKDVIDLKCLNCKNTYYLQDNTDTSKF